MNKSYVEWLDYYENATKEDVIQDLMLDINSIKEKDKEIKRLNKEFIELENWLKSEIERITKLKNPKKGVKPYGKEKEFYDVMINSYTYCLNKLKELKEGD